MKNIANKLEELLPLTGPGMLGRAMEHTRVDRDITRAEKLRNPVSIRYILISIFFLPWFNNPLYTRVVNIFKYSPQVRELHKKSFDTTSSHQGMNNKIHWVTIYKIYQFGNMPFSLCN